MTILSSQKVSPKLFMVPKKISPRSPHDGFNTSWSPIMSSIILESVFNMLPQELSKGVFNNYIRETSFQCTKVAFAQQFFKAPRYSFQDVLLNYLQGCLKVSP